MLHGKSLGGLLGASGKILKSKVSYLLLTFGVVLLVVFASVNITIKVDISLDARSGLMAETQIRPVDLRK